MSLKRLKRPDKNMHASAQLRKRYDNINDVINWAPLILFKAL
jgi:hypothetical protein